MDPIEAVNTNQQDNQQDKPSNCGRDHNTNNNNNSSNEIIEIDILNSDGEMCIDVENVESKQQGQDNSACNANTLVEDVLQQQQQQQHAPEESLMIVDNNNNNCTNTITNENSNQEQEKVDQVQPDRSTIEEVKSTVNQEQVEQVTQIIHEEDIEKQHEKESIIIDEEEDIQEQQQSAPQKGHLFQQDNDNTNNSTEQENQVTSHPAIAAAVVEQLQIQTDVANQPQLQQLAQAIEINSAQNEQIPQIIPEEDESDEEEELRQLKAIATTCSQKTSPGRPDEGIQSQEKKENNFIESETKEGDARVDQEEEDGEGQGKREIHQRNQKEPNSHILDEKHTLKSTRDGQIVNIPYKFMNKTKESSVSHSTTISSSLKEHAINREAEIGNHENHSQKKQESSVMELEVHSSVKGEKIQKEHTSFEENKEERQSINSKHIEKPNSQAVKSICEAPQSIASIFSQLAGIFSKMIIPQSMVNMSLHASKDVPQLATEDFKLQATLQEQMNQLQNQVTYIQSSVVEIPKHLQEVTDLLGRTVSLKGSSAKVSSSTTNGKLTKSTDLKENSKKSGQSKSSLVVGNGVTKKTEKAKDTSSEEEDEEDQSDDDNSSKNNSDAAAEDDDEDSSDDAEDQETIKALTNLSSKLASKKSPAVTTPKSSSSSVSSLLNLQALNQSKKTSYIQPKVGFTAPKSISSPFVKTPSRSDTLESSENSSTLADSINSVVINAASIGFREPKLFINESEQLIKSDDIEIEEESSLKGLYEHLNKLDRPSSFVLLKEQFTDLEDSQIQEVIDLFQEHKKIGLIRMFLPAYSKSQSARIEYYYVDMLIPPPKPKEEVKEHAADASQQPKQQGESSDQMEIQNIGDRKKYESMTDDQLLGYQKELNLRKQALLDKKLNANPTTDRIKKIQHWNEMKEVCSTIYERIAVLKQKTIHEICDEYGVQLDG